MTDLLNNKMVVVDDVKCRTSEEDSAPSGGAAKLRIEQAEERKKKPRRRKAKRKNPYQKRSSEMRQKSRKIYEQPVAPYNSNQFLMELHDDLQDFDEKLMSGDLGRRGRVRDASFTSAESDEDFFYSSPEDEEEFLSKEFSNTYRDLHVESLANMNKTELIQTIIHLEEKVDLLQKRLDSENESTTESTTKSPDQATQFQSEIAKLVLANKRLALENKKLREGSATRESSESSEDSESDSSSSSGSDDGAVRVNGDASPTELAPGQLLVSTIHNSVRTRIDSVQLESHQGSTRSTGDIMLLCCVARKSHESQANGLSPEIEKKGINEESTQKLNRAISRISSWTAKWRIRLNEAKAIFRA
ncbi:unnamed protein product [Nesidiocoris tenuis]|uniref:Uncharacterized protein n=1 Tax=Nesidiocoris tenuis TaxID=355587 RepID=A0A6H5HHT7_9HEMI|nr:unnamed protein product [Nesidiocoris tenuis]